MYIACLCPNLVSVQFYAIPILHFKFHKYIYRSTYMYLLDMDVISTRKGNHFFQMAWFITGFQNIYATLAHTGYDQMEEDASLDALWHHWRQTCLVSDKWNQAARNLNDPVKS